MTRIKLCVLALALVVSAPVAALAQVNVTGDWVVSIDSPQGATTIDLAMKQVGEDLTGTITSPMGSVEFKGKVVKDAISVSYNLDMQGNSVPITMTGTVAGSDITGNLNFGGLGDVPWTAKRKGGAAASPAPAARPAPAAPAATSGSDVSGKWEVTFVMAGNPMPASATFAQAGDKVTGTLSSQGGDTPVTGTMTGKALKLDFTVQTPQGDMQITMTGDLTADGITGKASLAGLGDAEWSAKRAK